jgi:hypothetical protein
MGLTFRTVAVGVIMLGVALGVAFGVGVAYGRGDPKETPGGLTAQQIQQLTGLGGASSFGAGGAGGASGTQGAAGGLNLLGANARAGRITAIEGSTLTIETRAGVQKVNLPVSALVNKVSAGARSDLAVGNTIVVSGTARDDGSFDAASVSQVPPELQALVTGTGTGGGGGTRPAGTPGASPAVTPRP